MDADNKKYKQMENVLNAINKNYISLPENDIRRNNKIFEQVTEKITNLMKEKDVLFKSMYERKFYGGSYYDGIKVGKPEEYDLDYVLNLPLIVQPVVKASDSPGFVHVRITEYMKILKRDEATKFEKLDTLMDNKNYLSTFKVLNWMESVMNLALNELKKIYPKDPEKGYLIMVKMNEDEEIPIYATITKAHPAFTLKLKNQDGTINLDIDLVPSFQFTSAKWPSPESGYRTNPFPAKNKFLIVPKNPHRMDGSNTLERYWRLSFQEQERELIKGHDFKSMKPTIKMLKKLRDKQNHVKIASYYIKTIFLWEVESQPKEFWQQPYSYIFMKMLTKYADMMQNKSIPYYWNQQNNLIGHLKEVTIVDIANTLRNIIADVEKNLADPFVIAKYLISQEQLDGLRDKVNLGKKHAKNLVIAQCLNPALSRSQSQASDKPDSVEPLSDDEKVRRLILNEEFQKEVAEQIAKYLRPRTDAQDEIMQSLEQLHVKNDKIAGMLSDLSDTCLLLNKRVENLETELTDSRKENMRLQSQLSDVKAETETDITELLFGVDRLALTAKSLPQCECFTVTQDANEINFLIPDPIVSECEENNERIGPN